MPVSESYSSHQESAWNWTCGPVLARETKGEIARKLLGKRHEKGQFVLFQWDVSTSGIAVGILSANLRMKPTRRWQSERERTPWDTVSLPFLWTWARKDNKFPAVEDSLSWGFFVTCWQKHHSWYTLSTLTCSIHTVCLTCFTYRLVIFIVLLYCYLTFPVFMSHLWSLHQLFQPT